MCACSRRMHWLPVPPYLFISWNMPRIFLSTQPLQRHRQAIGIQNNNSKSQLSTSSGKANPETGTYSGRGLGAGGFFCFATMMLAATASSASAGPGVIGSGPVGGDLNRAIGNSTVSISNQIHTVKTYHAGSAQHATLPVNNTCAYIRNIAQSPSRLRDNAIVDNRQAKGSTALSSSSNSASPDQARHPKRWQKGKQKAGQKKMTKPKSRLVSTGCQNKPVPQTMNFEGTEVKITSYKELAKINPTKISIFNNNLINLELVITSASNEIDEMSDDAIIEFVFQQTATYITTNEAREIRSNIKKLFNDMDYFLKNRGCFMFFSALDDPSVLGRCWDGKIFISDKSFLENEPMQTHLMLHEMAHLSAKARDDKYFQADAYYHKDSRGTELIDMSINRATRIFLKNFGEQIHDYLRTRNHDHSFAFNADSLVFVVFSLYRKPPSDVAPRALINSHQEIKSPENNEALPSLAYRGYPPRY